MAIPGAIPTSIAAWPVKQFDMYAKDQAFIYFLLDGEIVVYVGKTTRIHNRAFYHKTRREAGVVNKGEVVYRPGEFEWDSVWYMPVDPAKVSEIEREIILLLKPKFNKDFLCPKSSRKGRKPHANERENLSTDAGAEQAEVQRGPSVFECEQYSDADLEYFERASAE